MDDVNDLGWEQMVEEPTRGENFLDLFLTNHPNLVPRTETIPGLADHDAVYMELQIHPPKKRQPQRSIPIYTEECKQPLKEAAKQLNDHIVVTHNEQSPVEAIWSDLRQGLADALRLHVPHRQTKSKPSYPWIDYETKKMIRKRDRIRKRKKSSDEGLRQQFKSLKRQIQTRLRRLYWRYVEGLITDNPSDVTASKKKFWSFIKAKKT